MYKDRFKKWRLTKNITGVTGAEADAIVCTMAEREAVGKRTQIVRGGQRLDKARVLRHIKRRGSAAVKVGDVRTPKDACPLAGEIRLVTPPPSPPLEAGGELQGVERFFFNVRAWIDSNFDGGSWVVDPRSFQICGNFPDSPSRRCFSACDQFVALYYYARLSNPDAERVTQTQGARLYGQVLHHFRLAVAEQCPELLWELIRALAPHREGTDGYLFCHTYPHTDLDASLAEEASRVLNKHHPLTKVIEFVVGHAARLDRELIGTFSRFASAYFQQRVGRRAPFSLIMQRRSVRLAAPSPWLRRADIENCQHEYRKILSDIESLTPEGKSYLSRFTAKTKLRLAISLYSTGEGDEARRLASEASKTIYADEDPSKFSLFLLGLAEKQLGNRRASLAALFREMTLRLRSSVETGIMSTRLFVHPLLSAQYAAQRRTRCMDLAAAACSAWGLHDAEMAILGTRNLLLGALQSGTWDSSSADIMRSSQMRALSACATEYDDGALDMLAREFR